MTLAEDGQLHALALERLSGFIGLSEARVLLDACYESGGLREVTENEALFCVCEALDWSWGISVLVVDELYEVYDVDEWALRCSDPLYGVEQFDMNQSVVPVRSGYPRAPLHWLGGVVPSFPGDHMDSVDTISTVTWVDWSGSPGPAAKHLASANPRTPEHVRQHQPRLDGRRR